MTHNLGRDISKFFFGGYSLQSGKKPHTHSQTALDIVQTLIVGTVDRQAAVQDELFRITSKTQVNSTTATFTLSSSDNEPVSNIRAWYDNPEMIGRHFLVYSLSNPTVKRHYTICSSMQPALVQ